MTRSSNISQVLTWLPGAGFTKSSGEWGEDSPLWQSRVLGCFPEQAQDALISLKWLEAARGPKVLPNDEVRLYAGIDSADRR